jgi:hypothetical protein
LHCLQRYPNAVQQIDENGANCLHYLARYHGRKTKVLTTACSGAAGRAAARAVYKSKTGSQLLPLQLLCRYHAREEASVNALASAYPEAVQSRDDQGASHDDSILLCSLQISNPIISELCRPCAADTPEVLLVSPTEQVDRSPTDNYLDWYTIL